MHVCFLISNIAMHYTEDTHARKGEIEQKTRGKKNETLHRKFSKNG